MKSSLKVPDHAYRRVRFSIHAPFILRKQLVLSRRLRCSTEVTSFESADICSRRRPIWPLPTDRRGSRLSSLLITTADLGRYSFVDAIVHRLIRSLFLNPRWSPTVQFGPYLLIVVDRRLSRSFINRVSSLLANKAQFGLPPASLSSSTIAQFGRFPLFANIVNCPILLLSVVCRFRWPSKLVVFRFVVDIVGCPNYPFPTLLLRSSIIRARRFLLCCRNRRPSKLFLSSLNGR